ncbi:MAG: hypothetical protein ACW99G_15320 [Candidatus Thorarchaeota archaeon]|jgi:hypothetical protein
MSTYELYTEFRERCDDEIENGDMTLLEVLRAIFRLLAYINDLYLDYYKIVEK